MGTERVLRHRLAEIRFELEDMGERREKAQGRLDAINDKIAALHTERKEIKADLDKLGYLTLQQVKIA